ncbi:MAG: DEAD/DEAH box helicase, partial [Opitutales bacterium]
EYQMLADDHRGINYELAVALAPVGTQLLMLSGSVANPERIVEWLRSNGREAVLVRHKDRPVPLEEVQIEALPDRLPVPVKGKWPRWIARALAVDMGPVLVFAPQRKTAEELAKKISAALPLADWLELTREQRAVAGDELSKLLRNRIAFHHSGLSYPQRAGLIEPLAKAGQLRVIVATTGLAAGINFSMRSVLVTEREYVHGGRSHPVRSDELLHMFGRARRRGLDTKGYVLVAPDRPRLHEARPAVIRRTSKVDWPSFLATMHNATRTGDDPVEAARGLASRLFSEKRVVLGFERIRRGPRPGTNGSPVALGGEVSPPKRIKEMLNSQGLWERLKPPTKAPLGDTLVYREKQWQPALSLPITLEKVPLGNLCRLETGNGRRYGRVVPLASLPQGKGEGNVALVKWLSRALRAWYAENRPEEPRPRRFWSIEELEKEIVPLLPHLTQGGVAVDLEAKGNALQARLDYGRAVVHARTDSEGARLLNPPIREVDAPDFPSFAELAGYQDSEAAKRTPAEIWEQLKLIDKRQRPTRRGVIASFFNHGEGLAVAAALEDASYPLDELIFDLANLRAGHRFNELGSGGGRLAAVCRLAYRGLTASGYLDHGLPPDYGEGASELLAILESQPQRRSEFVDGNLGNGDIERATVEWRSLLNHVAFAPDYEWKRWREFQDLCRAHVATYLAAPRVLGIPDLAPSQRMRYIGRFL